MNDTARTATKPATLSIDQARRAIPMSKNVAYETVARTGQLLDGVPVIQVGHRLRVITAELEQRLGIDIADHLTAAELAGGDTAT